MNADAQRRLDRLVNLLLAGTLSPEDQVALESLLTSSPELMDRYLDQIRLHLDLTRLGSHPENRIVAATRPTPASNTRYRWLARVGAIAGGVAALGLICAWYWGPSLGTRESAQQARHHDVKVDRRDNTEAMPRIGQSANAKIFGEGFAPRVGDQVTYLKEYVLTEGSLALIFPSGAEALVTAPCVFEANNAESLTVRSGQCSVYAPPGAEGFRVMTPTTAIQDLGTRFAVGVDVTGDTAVQVVEGEASFTTSAEPTSATELLTAGQSAFIDTIGTRRDIPATHPIHYRKQLPDRVVDYETTTDAEGLAEELLGVTVQRDGHSYTYGRNELWHGRLVGYSSKANTAIFCTAQGDPLPEGNGRLDLLRDWNLVTGIINFEWNSDPSNDTAGMALEFSPPVVNSAGPDLVLFDLQLLVGREAGDVVTVSTPESIARDAVYEIERFDLDLTSHESKDLRRFQVYSTSTNIASIDELIRCQAATRKQTYVRSKALATGIDLSDLGYALGETVHRIQFADTRDDGEGIDPVMVVALPPVPSRADAATTEVAQ